MKQSALAVEVDTRYAPQILICRFARWPSPDEQEILRHRLIGDGHFGASTSAVVDIRRLYDLPNPDQLAHALAQAFGKNSLFKRAACVVESIEQTALVESFRRMATRPNVVGVFFSADDALCWLVAQTESGE